MRDLIKGEDEDLIAVATALAEVQPDVLVLGGIDYDPGGHTLEALGAFLTEHGLELPYRFSAEPNGGMRTGFDMNGDGRVDDPQDAQSYGTFPGAGGLAVLANQSLKLTADLTSLLWQDAPATDPPMAEDGTPFPSAKAFAAQRLPYSAHWRIEVASVTLVALAASPPVFDGPEDRNGRRNADELKLIETALGQERPVVVLGTLNLDPRDGDGRREALHGLLDHPQLQDPAPRSEGGALRAQKDAGANLTHRGDPALDTADFRDEGPGDPGNLRVDYVLPDARLAILDAGLHWPAQGRRAVVWVDLDLP